MNLPARKMRERSFTAPRAAARVPFALRDFRELCFQANDKAPQSFWIELVKQSTRGEFPTEAQLQRANTQLGGLGLPLSECPTRDRVLPRKPTEPTPAEIKAQAVRAVDAMHVGRKAWLTRPTTRSEYAPVPSEVLKLRARDAQPDRFEFETERR